MRRKEHLIPMGDSTLIPQDDQIKPPSYFRPVNELPKDPDAYLRKPVTSAHSIDVNAGALSKQDNCSIDTSAGGDVTGVVHGRYGKLSIEQVRGIPLEYLSMLHKAAEGAAAVRTLDPTGENGTVLVYGATNPAAMAAVQLASAKGMAAVAVVGGEHSGNDEAVDMVKGFAFHPGTAVTEAYAVKKGPFRDLVKAVSEGEAAKALDKDTIIADFRANLKDYCAAFEDEAGGVNFSDADLAKFSSEHYAVLKQKFKIRGNQLLRGDTSGPSFEPVNVVQDMLRDPNSATLDGSLKQQISAQHDGPFVPYELSVLESKSMPGLDNSVGGPIRGAVIAATPSLKVACKAVAGAAKGGKRAQAEALQFLTASERNAYAAASSVANLARAAGGEVVVVGGSLDGLSSVNVSKEDVSAALDAMRIDSNTGDSKLNFFVQVFRACDFQSYEDYAIHKATEPLSGPREKIVTK